MTELMKLTFFGFQQDKLPTLKIIFLILMIGFIQSCKKDKTKKSNTPIEKLEYLWKVPLYEGSSNVSNSSIDANLIFENHFLLSIIGEDNRNYLSYRNILNGKEKWRWDERFVPESEEYTIYQDDFYEYNDLFTYVNGSRHYCIDLNTGSTEWKIRRLNNYDSEIKGIGNDYFVLGKANDTLENHKTFVVHKGNLTTGSLKQHLLPVFNFENLAELNSTTLITHVSPIIKNGDTTFFVSGGDPYPNSKYNTHLGLFNSSNESWDYSSKIINTPNWANGIVRIIVENGKAYLTTGSYIDCYQVGNGERLWRNNLGGSFLFSKFILRDGKIFTNNEGGNEGGHMYGIDAKTGNILWKTRTGGTSSSLRYLNGIVYMSGGSSNRIHAIDGNTGKHVWKLDPKYLDDGISDFKWDLYAWEGDGINKGRVVVCTGRYAYCFETYQ